MRSYTGEDKSQKLVEIMQMMQVMRSLTQELEAAVLDVVDATPVIQLEE